MKILSQTYPGSIKICRECGCLFSFLPSDIYEKHWLYCPICKTRMESPMDLRNEKV